MYRVKPLPVTPEDLKQLEIWARSRVAEHRLVLRAKVILGAAAGRTNREIARELSLDEDTIRKWRLRYLERGLDGLKKDLPRGSGPPRLSPEKEREIVETTLHKSPPNATHWSVRTMAEHLGVTKDAVHRTWRKFELKPHLLQTFKLSNDPNFLEKLVDVVGLYMNPPERAMVFSFDEKSQIQALDRTQPLLPMGLGFPARQTHDYKRNGTTTLFAAMNMLDGKIIADCHERHTHEEFLNFLKKMNRETPKGLDLHLILDNYATHKHPNVKKWLARHKRFHFHFIPTSSSWLNLIERWFRELTDKQIRRGTFNSVDKLIEVIERFIEHHNFDPKPFIWSAPVDRILAKIAKIRQQTATPH